MALFVARPSRSSWVFFVLVALGVAAARGYGNYERSVVRRDAPVAELAQDLAACTFGSDSAWLLAGPSTAVWQEAIGSWMRRAVAAPQDPAWLSRCVPYAGRLAERLGRTASANEAVVASATALHHSLQEAARDPLERVALVDSDVLPRQFVDVFDKVRALSEGAREGWRAVPVHHDRFGVIPTARTLPLRPLPSSLLRPTLLSGSAFAAFSTVDGAVHRYDFGRPGGAVREATAGVGVPVGVARDGAVRLESDRGLGWLLAGPDARSLAAPDDLAIEGDPSHFAWDLASGPRAAALLTLDYGSARVRATPLEGPLAWTAPAVVGSDESAAAAVMAPDGDAWRVTVLRPLVSTGVLEQYTLRYAPVAAPADPAAPVAPRGLVVDGPARVASELALYDARVLTCAAGAARYFALVSEQDVTVLRVDGARVRTAHTAVMWPRNREVTFTCDASRALVGTLPVMARTGHFLFSFGGRDEVGVAVEPPTVGPAAAVRAVVLVRDGVMALVANAGALRAYRQRLRVGLRGASPWEPAGLVALAAPSAQWTRTFTRVEALATGDRVTMIVAGGLVQHLPRPAEGQEATAQPAPEPQPVPYFTLAGTIDGGATFWSL